MSSDDFARPIAPDNQIYCGQYGPKGIYKLCLDSFADGDRDTAVTWLRHIENYIIADMLKKEPTNRYADYRKLKFKWKYTHF